MSIRRVLLAWTVAAAAVGVGFAAPARAAAPRDQGWWTVTNPLPPTPDVPARGLLIQAGGGGAPTAYAAVLYELDPGSTAGSLTLTVAPNSLTTPSATLQICPLLQPINHPDAGGPMSDAPPYNCGKSVKAAPSGDGKSYQLSAADLVSDRVLAVAILPTGPADRVVLNPPEANSLATTEGAGTDAGSSVGDTGAGIAPGDSAAPPATEGGASGFGDTGASPSLASSLPGVSASGPSAVSPAASAAPSNLPGSGGTFVPAVASAPEKATPLLVVLFVIGALGGVALWLYAGRQSGTAALSGPVSG